MPSLYHFMAQYGGWFAAASVAGVALGLILVPYFIARMPEDYFSAERHGEAADRPRHPVARALWAVGRNIIGAVLVIAGLLMLVLPGQGILTLLMGLMIMDYPGKSVLIRRVAGRPHVLRAMNWLRARYGRPPLHPPPGQ